MILVFILRCAFYYEKRRPFHRHRYVSRHRVDKACLVSTTPLLKSLLWRFFGNGCVIPPLFPRGDNVAYIFSRGISEICHFADYRHRRDKACLVYTTTLRETTAMPIFHQW
ncbi:MAG: hypothetical protein M0O96_10555 [Desulforhopalus sp.]|nr:hypothetical protein [Desulforhopalus sp.]